MAWLTYSTTENPAGLCASQFAAASASCSHFTHSSHILQSSHRLLAFLTSAVAAAMWIVWSLPGYNYAASSHIMQSGHRSLAVLSSAVAAAMWTASVAAGNFALSLSLSGRCLHAATVVAHLLQSSPRIGHLPPGRYQVLLCCGVLRASASPTWSLPSLKRCGFRSRIRHPPLGRYQVYNHIKKRTI